MPRRLTPVALAAALSGLTAVVGLMVMLGWWLQWPALTQLAPGLAPMQFNTAMGFTLAGGALWSAIHRGPHRLILIPATTLLVMITGLSLWEYLTAQPLGIDTVFADAFVADRTSHPGRMSPPTAVGLLLAALAIALQTVPQANRQQHAAWSPYFGAMLLTLGLAALTAYLWPARLPEDTVHLSRMAIHTGAGFCLLGLSLLLISVPGRFAAAALGGVVSALFALSVWITLEGAERTRLLLLAGDHERDFVAAIENDLQQHLQILRLINPSVDDPAPTARLKALQQLPYLEALGIASTDRQLMLLGQALPDAPFDADLSRDTSPDEELVISGEWLYVRLLVRASGQDPASAVIARLALGRAIQQQALRELQGLWYQLTAPDGTLLARSGQFASALYRGQLNDQLGVPSLNLQLTVRLSRTFVARHASNVPVLFLLGAMVIALLAFAVINLLLRIARHSDELQRRQGLLSAENDRRRIAESDLRRQTERLQSSNEQLNDFAYVVSHDLREPLRGISSTIRFAIEDHADEVSADLLRRLTTIDQLTKNLTRLIADLLQFSRASQAKDRYAEVSLDYVLDDALEPLQCFLQEHRVTVVRPQQALPKVICDQTRLAEALRKLVTNATLYNDSHDKHIEMRLDQDEDNCPVLRICDNGIGIDPRARVKIFRMFTRLHHDGEYGSGTGAGLAIAAKIVESHNGKIWIEDPPTGQQGACVCVRLLPPGHPAAAQLLASTSAGASPSS